MMIGFELDEAKLGALPALVSSGKPASIWLAAQLIDDGLLVVPAGPRVVRWLPPMNLSDAQADEALQIFHQTLDRILASLH
jgi:acetylornithine/succinyldiaminopimelate/putrescine aminotransferase